MQLIIGCGGAILKDKKILLIKRVASKKNYPNCWAFPAGKLDDTDKSIVDAVVREVKEETNLNFVPIEKLGFYETSGSDEIIIGFIYLGNWTGELKIQKSEVADVGWFSYSETKNLDIAFSYNEAINDIYNRGLIE